MKVKIAGFTVTPHHLSVHLMDHAPVTDGFCQVTEWVEVELPDLPAEVVRVNRLGAIAKEREVLQARLDALS